MSITSRNHVECKEMSVDVGERTNTSVLAIPTVQDRAQAEAIEQLNWLLMPVSQATAFVQSSPFFIWLDGITDVRQFAPVAKQIYHHSITLPRAIALMLSVTDREDSHLFKFYAAHAFEESDHHLLALDWMQQHGIVRSRSELDHLLPTIETTSCINVAYHIAMERDHDMWIATMNTAIERCFWLFFCAAARKMTSLGAGHEYFDVHVEADEEHSVAGLRFLKPIDPTSSRALILRTRALEGVSLWTAMVHSWIGIRLAPVFREDGTIHT